MVLPVRLAPLHRFLRMVLRTRRGYKALPLLLRLSILSGTRRTASPPSKPSASVSKPDWAKGDSVVKRVIAQSTAALLLVFVAGPKAVDGHGGDPNVVHACVNPSSGEIKIVAPDAPCRPTETALHLALAPEGGSSLEVVVVTDTFLHIPFEFRATGTASCPAGKVATGGGFKIT